MARLHCNGLEASTTGKPVFDIQHSKLVFWYTKLTDSRTTSAHIHTPGRAGSWPQRRIHECLADQPMPQVQPAPVVQNVLSLVYAKQAAQSFHINVTHKQHETVTAGGKHCTASAEC
jgi:hypothetical protein